MLSKENNELLTRVGPGTPMGRLLREYWMPACRSAKLEADGATQRVRLLGENLVAFRATDGRVACLAEACPHRCASLALARNEGNGLRCIFHGWKVSVDGVCVDAPSEPEDQRAAFAAKVRVRHYPVREAGGMVWVYLGARSQPPRFPDFEFNNLPANHVMPVRGLLKCNWLQGLEAFLDSAHVPFLHAANVASFGKAPNTALRATTLLTHHAPRIELVERPYGFREGALRPADGEQIYARIREVVLPYFSFISGRYNGVSTACCAIPIDDEHTAQWYIMYNSERPLDGFAPGGSRRDPDYFNADMGGWDNLWHQDRAAMKDHWSGFTGKPNWHEDFAVQESMGPIADRSIEHLGQADVVIIRARKLLIDAVHRFEQTGETSFAGDEVEFDRIRSLELTYPSRLDWRELDAFDPPIAMP